VGDVAAFATERWTLRYPAPILSSRQPHNRPYANPHLCKQFVARSVRVREKVRIVHHLEPLHYVHLHRTLCSRSQRKAAPSPLQTITTATTPPSSATPTRTTFSRTGVDHSSKSIGTHNSPPEQPRSPKERLDDLLASEKSFYNTSEESSVESIPIENSSRYFGDQGVRHSEC
jgi:hypothetical protein